MCPAAPSVHTVRHADPCRHRHDQSAVFAYGVGGLPVSDRVPSTGLCRYGRVHLQVGRMPHEQYSVS